MLIVPLHLHGQTWRGGTFLIYNQPIGELSNWYAGTPDVGVNFIKMGAGTRIELEYHYSNFTHGSPEKTPFMWQVDKKYYKSPQANANMSLHRFLVNFLFMKNQRHVFGQDITPYFKIGAGLYAFNNRVSGLIYPGQGRRPLDASLFLPPVSDKQVAIGADFGIGYDLKVTEKMNLDFRWQYNMILGTIRPFEDWGLKEIFPIQAFDFGIGVQYSL